MDFYPVSAALSTGTRWVEQQSSRDASIDISVYVDLAQEKWLSVGSAVFTALEAIVEDKALLKDLAHITGCYIIKLAMSRCDDDVLCKTRTLRL